MEGRGKGEKKGSGKEGMIGRRKDGWKEGRELTDGWNNGWKGGLMKGKE